MKYFFRIIRWPLGQLVIFIDWVTRPPFAQHSAERRAELDAITSTMQLYQFGQCPFCVKTRRNMRRLGLNIELRDARNDPRWQRELIEGGGRYQVPCLRLAGADGGSEWLYGSADIIRYLDQRFG
jgi:glutaredoxin